MIIDAHHHFWKYDPIEYDWIDDSMKYIRKDFLPDRLNATIETASVDGVISVQARQTMEETNWLLSLASQNNFIKGVVGWLPIADSNFKDLLEKYAVHPKLKALRHVIQGESDDHFILGKNFNQGISILKEHNLAYDILIFERHLNHTIKFVDQHPNQVFVLDHMAKPKIKIGELSPWRENITELAKRENVFCKISGMVTEANFTNWNESLLQPYFNTVLEAFNSDRLLFGSDWPVCLVGVEYKTWMELVKQQISKLSNSEQKNIMGLNAINAYNL